jgi:hypothetical protein
VANCCAIGRSCSDALNALVSRIVCAVGFRETMCFFRLAEPFFFVLLLELPGFDFPLELLSLDPEVFPAVPDLVPDFDFDFGFSACFGGDVVCDGTALLLAKTGKLTPIKVAANTTDHALPLMVTIDPYFSNPHLHSKLCRPNPAAPIAPEPSQILRSIGLS